MTPADERHALDWLPAVFETHIGGYTGRSYSITLDGDALRYESFDYGYEPKEVSHIEPDANRWRRLWATLDRVDALSWSGKYVNSDVLDGTGWSISIEHDGRRVEATGSNAYPPDGDGPELTSEFRRFCRAIERLLGGLDFR